MLYHEEQFIGKNGKVYTLRSPNAADAEMMIDYLKTTAAETEHGLSYPEEMDFSVADEEAFITNSNTGEGSIMISVFDGTELVGNASLCGVLGKKKTLHRAEFGLAILKKHWRQGLGRKLVSELIQAAKNAGYEQLELEVVATNITAIELYRKLGFQVYGERPHSFKLKSGDYSNELLMVLNLS